MPGFCIYCGEIKSKDELDFLRVYANTTSLEIDGEQKDFLDKINDFNAKANGDISFTYQSDASVPYTYRGSLRHYMTTYYINVRIIKREKLYFLIQKDRFDKAELISSKLSRHIYGSTKHILPYIISSELIKKIENTDSLTVRRVYFSKLNARDSSVGIIGNLSRRKEDDTHDYSIIHEEFKDREKSFSEFTSYSRGSRVLVSGNKNSLTLMNLADARPSYDDAESYIKEYIIPQAAPNSVSQIGAD